MDKFNIEPIIERFLMEKGMSLMWANITSNIIGLVALVVLAALADFLTKRILLVTISKIVIKSKNQWDDIILQKNFFKRVAHLAPSLVIYYGIGFTLSEQPALVNALKMACLIYMVIMTIMAINALFISANDIYNSRPIAKSRPIKGYIQLVQIFIYFIGGILILSLLLDKSPSRLLAGLGAMAAVILLVFKDSILGFSASIQLSANNMLEVGDWISMPSHNTDGTVLEITLNTVKIQNWDKTISTIPTYALVSESFQNWRGMEKSGGRRIKRSVNIDIKSIKFADEETLAKLSEVHLLNEFIGSRQKEINKYNEEKGLNTHMPVNGRRMTNIGLFRRYIEAYLKNHPSIHKEMTFLVRQLQPTEKGVPIEIYVFSKVQAWADYESIQADIFDHILAATPYFGLKLFQHPTGDDFQRLSLGK